MFVVCSRNKSSLKSLSRLVVQPHQGSIYSACFSHDGTKIASCGSSKTLRVFKSTSGEKLLEIQAHDDEVLCCAFSPDDRLLATCSSDRKVKYLCCVPGLECGAWDSDEDV
ncbi:unnamed protein product [Oncorhynchus mykiss]|uniref:Uncharacterized protein n=1 Tax=Oncorhynchus mykiss TaxID=8022 RepID=A0A060Z5Q0_ONCMY|nr:unnamed protein product [Oncorhynchus mykiss]